MKGATIAQPLDVRRHIVSIRAPVKGATGLLDPVAGAERFNPRAREGRDGVGGGEGAADEVSIRAPVKGAT